jgi:alpha-tubulin suppressor-like RCC1 family protein
MSPKQTAIPKKVDIAGIKKISCNHHTAAINSVGALFFWGTSVFGTFYEPRIIIDTDVVDVSVGGSFGICKDKDGLLWSWGKNSTGELAQADSSTKLYPHPIL